MAHNYTGNPASAVPGSNLVLSTIPDDLDPANVASINPGGFQELCDAVSKCLEAVMPGGAIPAGVNVNTALATPGQIGRASCRERV